MEGWRPCILINHTTTPLNIHNAPSDISNVRESTPNHIDTTRVERSICGQIAFLKGCSPMARRIDWKTLKRTEAAQLAGIVEIKARDLFRSQLRGGLTGLFDSCKSVATHVGSQPKALSASSSSELKPSELRLLLDASLLTFALHVEARLASALGQGFYTIGPCGEEQLSAIALALRPTDAVALHYRHVAVSVARQVWGCLFFL